MLDFGGVCGYAIEDENEVTFKEYPPDDASEEPYSIAYTSWSSASVTSRSRNVRSPGNSCEDESLPYEPYQCSVGCSAPPPEDETRPTKKQRSKSAPSAVDRPETRMDTPNLLEDSMFEILSPQDSHDGLDAQILNQEIMEGMQTHFPLVKKGESFWLQYSLVRDGASMEALLWKIRNTEHSVMAVETVDGEVFGAYTSHKWQEHHDFFGSRESFLWRWNPQQEEGEEKLEFFHFSHLNDDVQLCTPNRLAVGGGIRKFDPEYGFGLSLSRDLLTGTTNKSMTFLNPPLSKLHADGSTCREGAKQGVELGMKKDWGDIPEDRNSSMKDSYLYTLPNPPSHVTYTKD
eukprot:scaffold14515_cov97-Cylindrotheca_fusiformis.AAC.5